MESDIANVINADLKEDYKTDTFPIALGYESHANALLISMIKEWFCEINYPRLVRIKDESAIFSKRKQYGKYTAFEKMRKNYLKIQPIKFIWFGKLGGRWGYQYILAAHCMRYFAHDSQKILDKFISETYGDLENAIQSTRTYVELWNQFEYWFDERGNRFMEKMQVEIQEKKKVAVRKTPQSHGGVANLLKILTKTMQEQGSDIRSIAKVQYAICVQAGIYIPEEFIRDVAVALSVENGDV